MLFKLILFIIIEYYLSKICAAQLLNRDELILGLDHLRSNTSIEVQKNASLEVISRLLPNHSHLFEVEITDELIRSFQLIKDDNSTKLTIRGSDGVSICKGFYHYLKYFLNSSVSWSGNQIDNIPDDLPTVNIEINSTSRFIYYQNVCTWGYSFVWWKWEDWRKHIDWMALMGISLTIAPIQEAIWMKIYRNMGLTKDEIDDHFSGPGFLPWQRMGNIRGWGGALSKEYMDNQLILQKQIIKAQRDLGMTVAIPGFAGQVPVAMKRIYPNLTFTSVDCWNQFTKQYCCPLFVDPSEKLFHQIGEKFISAVIQEYGTDHLYFSDPFNEEQPRRSDANYLSEISKNIYKTMTDVDSEAIWLLQGWMFVKNPFWTDNLLKAFLTAVPQGKILILDLQSELFPQYERTQSYYGQPFIWCMLHNFGGTLGMHGSINIVNTRIQLAWNMEQSTMIGVGITPEGINQNYAVYEFALERGWVNESFNENDWFEKYTQVRYGILDENIIQAWKLIRETVYSYKNLIKLHGKYTIARRPSLKINPWVWYEPTKIKDALQFLLSANTSLYDNQQYQHDIVDLTRQFLQLIGDTIYLNITSAYKEKNLHSLKRFNKQMLKVFEDLENILASNDNFLLGKWLENAKQLGTTDLEKEIYELNARNQITIWGPNAQIIDYATKQWSGIIKDFFMPRWELFLNGLTESLTVNKKFDENKFREKVFKEVEKPFTIDNKIYPIQKIGNSIKLATQILDYWTNQIECNNLNMNNIPIRVGHGCYFQNTSNKTI